MNTYFVSRSSLDCIAARIVVESPDCAPRVGGLGTDSLCAAQKKELGKQVKYPKDGMAELKA